MVQHLIFLTHLLFIVQNSNQQKFNSSTQKLPVSQTTSQSPQDLPCRRSGRQSGVPRGVGWQRRHTGSGTSCPPGGPRRKTRPPLAHPAHPSGLNTIQTQYKHDTNTLQTRYKHCGYLQNKTLIINVWREGLKWRPMPAKNVGIYVCQNVRHLGQ